MLLSRVAENVYWTGRYLERAEASARLVEVHTGLYIDLPLSSGMGWSPLLLVTGSGEAFEQTRAAVDGAREDDVVEFLATDHDNAGSIIASLHHARMNMRVTRDQFPPAAWEELNALWLWADDHIDDAVPRRTRSRWTREVIRRCQLLSGLLADAMSHDQVWSFLEIGRFLERADMTTRVLDVQAGVLAGTEHRPDHGEPWLDVTWKTVLESLGARHPFHRAMRSGVSGPNALSFLLRDGQFPRSVEHCLTRISRALIELPAHEEPMHGCAEVERFLEDADTDDIEPDHLHEFVDELQVRIAGLHALLGAAYFAVATEATQEQLALLA